MTRENKSNYQETNSPVANNGSFNQGGGNKREQLSICKQVGP